VVQWLTCVLWEHEIPGSSPGTPTKWAHSIVGSTPHSHCGDASSTLAGSTKTNEATLRVAFIMVI
jgi:hypothetical protein